MISFIIPWDERTDDPWRIRSKIITTEYISTFFPDSEICIGTDNSEPFNRSKARNNAFAKSSNDTLVVLDADSLVPASSINEAIGLLDNNWVIPYNTYYNLSKETTSKIFSKTNSSIDQILFEPEDHQYDHKIISWAGALVLDRSMWEMVNGYDERFVGWGWEDVAFRIKLDAKVGKHIRCGSYINHLWHPRGEADFNTSYEIANRKLFDREYRRKYNWKDERI